MRLGRYQPPPNREGQRLDDILQLKGGMKLLLRDSHGNLDPIERDAPVELAQSELRHDKEAKPFIDVTYVAGRPAWAEIDWQGIARANWREIPKDYSRGLTGLYFSTLLKPSDKPWDGPIKIALLLGAVGMVPGALLLDTAAAAKDGYDAARAVLRGLGAAIDNTVQARARHEDWPPRGR